MIEIFACSAGVILIYFTLLFVLGWRLNNYAIADIGWGLGFVLTTLFYAYMTDAQSAVFLLTAGLICLWGCRLSVHIYFRNRGKPEDFRYKELRGKWRRFPNLQAYIKLFLTQAFLMLILSITILIAAYTRAEMNIAGWIAFSSALLGFLYESISDYQLAQFKRDLSNRGKIMRYGLWKYSRHPNYFGEILFWWSLSFMVAVTTSNWFALVSGLMMNLLIVFVSGIPMLEDKYKNNPEYQNYKRSTNALLPKIYRNSAITGA